jgi:hypothetical protein
LHYEKNMGGTCSQNTLPLMDTVNNNVGPKNMVQNDRETKDAWADASKSTSGLQWTI